MHVPIPPAPNFAAQPMSQALKSGLPPSGAPGTAGSKPALPPIRYSAAVTSSGSATTSSALAPLNTNVLNPTNTTSPPAVGPATPIAASSQATSSPSRSTAGNQDLQPSSPSTSSSSAASSSANHRGRGTPPPSSVLNTSSHESPPHSPAASSTGTGTSGNSLRHLSPETN
jgi:CCR4-NOT transcription complex subunit 3